jgi:hypothetical protein
LDNHFLKTEIPYDTEEEENEGKSQLKTKQEKKG